MRILITGITGFVGAWLARYLVEDLREPTVYGLVRWSSHRDSLKGLTPALTLVDGDLRDGASLVRVAQSARPELVFHLAASSTVASSWSTPAELMDVNVAHWGRNTIRPSVVTVYLPVVLKHR